VLLFESAAGGGCLFGLDSARGCAALHESKLNDLKGVEKVS
jgi:hypothetical protein